MDPAAIAQAVWEYATRSLVEGTPDAPSNRAEEIAQAVWEYTTRALTGVGGSVIPVFIHHYQHSMGR